MSDRAELAAEQAHVDHAYRRLLVRRGLADELAEPEMNESAGELHERDVRDAARRRWVRELRLGDLPLCFGRIDTDGGERWHIGRVGVDDEHGDRLVVDWRAPVAEAFYRATPMDPSGVIRRRHIRCRGATVLGLDDELFGEAATDDTIAVVGEAALFRALDRRRTGRMHDIVATIQADQDRIIRAPIAGTVVVQGGPGTGKTAVALHRIAYLLHAHREELERKGVLLIGPSPTFLRYIESVLPSLGEQGATLRTVATLRHVDAVRSSDSPVAARVKGDGRMADVLARAVANRQRPLARAAVVPFGAFTLRVPVEASTQLVDRTRRRPGTHNERRPRFERDVTGYLYRYLMAVRARAERAGQPVAPLPTAPDFAASVRSRLETRAAVERMWPVLTPEALLHDLFAHPPLLREAAGGLLTDEEQAALHRAGGEWTEADDALLDELAVLLGEPPAPPPRRASDEDLDYMADRVIEGVAADADIALSVTMREEIRERIRNEQVAVAPPERPRTVSRTYGHVVVDEAQDLSPMQWRMVARRAPAGSLTLVGDRGQASGAWRLGWEDVVGIVATDAEASIVELDVNYRTRREVMDVAARVLAAADPGLAPPTSVRAGGSPPRFVRAARLAPDTAAEAKAVLGDLGRGTVAVIAHERRHAELRAALDADASTAARGHEPIDDPVALLTPARAKGLEFDAVIVAEPADIAAANLLSLYVAMTRATERLVIVYSELPECLANPA